MNGIEIKSFDKPDETRMFEGEGLADLVNLARRPMARVRSSPAGTGVVMAQVEIQSGPHRIVSLMSRDALDDHDLRRRDS